MSVEECNGARHSEVLSQAFSSIFLFEYILYNKLKLFFLYFNIVFELSESLCMIYLITIMRHIYFIFIFYYIPI